jgi:hypothetical protein
MAQSRHELVHRTCPLLGVKQTWPFAECRFHGRYWVQSGHDLVRRTCLLMTQSGHVVLNAQSRTSLLGCHELGLFTRPKAAPHCSQALRLFIKIINFLIEPRHLGFSLIGAA